MENAIAAKKEFQETKRGARARKLAPRALRKDGAFLLKLFWLPFNFQKTKGWRVGAGENPRQPSSYLSLKKIHSLIEPPRRAKYPRRLWDEIALILKKVWVRARVKKRTQTFYDRTHLKMIGPGKALSTAIHKID